MSVPGAGERVPSWTSEGAPAHAQLVPACVRVAVGSQADVLAGDKQAVPILDIENAGVARIDGAPWLGGSGGFGVGINRNDGVSEAGRVAQEAGGRDHVQVVAVAIGVFLDEIHGRTGSRAMHRGRRQAEVIAGPVNAEVVGTESQRRGGELEKSALVANEST